MKPELTFPAVVPQHAHFFNLAQQCSVLSWNTEKDAHHWDRQHTRSHTPLLPSLTVVAVVVHQNDLFDQVRRTFLQNATEGDQRVYTAIRSEEINPNTPLETKGCASGLLPTWPQSAAERSEPHYGRWWPHWMAASPTSTACVCNCAHGGGISDLFNFQVLTSQKLI